jgi:hypothetical protein
MTLLHTVTEQRQRRGSNMWASVLSSSNSKCKGPEAGSVSDGTKTLGVGVMIRAQCAE